MTISVTDQALIFLYSFTCGILIGIIFDVFRILRRLIHTGNIITSLQDIIFWVLSLITVVICAIRFNYGIIRWYMLAAIGIGAAIYFLTISKIIMLAAIFLINIIKKALAIVVKILLVPVKLIMKLFKKPVFFVINISKAGFKKILSKINTDILSFKKYLKVLKKRKYMV